MPPPAIVKNNMAKKKIWPLSLCTICGDKNPQLSWEPLITCSRRCRNTYIARKTALSPERRRKLSIAKLGEKNPNWLGDKIRSYTALHAWVRRHLTRPTLCQECKKVPPYDLANKGKYIRDFSQWEFLCRRCHMRKDGRLNRFWRLAPQHVNKDRHHPPLP